MSSLHRAMRKLSRRDPNSEDSAFVRDVASAVGKFLSHLDNLKLDLADVSLEREFGSVDELGNKIIRKYVSKAGKTIVNLMEGVGKTVISKIFKHNHEIPNTLEDEYKVQREKALKKDLKRVKAASQVKEKTNYRLNEDRVADLSVAITQRPLGGDVDDLSTTLNQTVIERVSDAVAKFFKRGGGCMVDTTAVDVHAMFGLKPNQTRKRLPRAFYGGNQFYSFFKDIDAEALWRLFFALGKESHDFVCIHAFDGFNDYDGQDTDLYSVMVFTQAIIWYNTRSDRIKWAITPDNVEKIERCEKGIVIYLKDGPGALEEKTLRFRTLDKVRDEFVYQVLLSLVECWRHKGYLKHSGYK